jgi:hypothetical protein
VRAEIQTTFGLTDDEIADLCARASVEAVLDLARLFRQRVVASGIPEIVRTADDWLGGRTILQVLRDDGAAPVYVYLGAIRRWLTIATRNPRSIDTNLSNNPFWIDTNVR